eukprot:1021860-Rhodomonas_salina.1
MAAASSSASFFSCLSSISLAIGSTFLLRIDQCRSKRGLSDSSVLIRKKAAHQTDRSPFVAACPSSPLPLPQVRLWALCMRQLTEREDAGHLPESSHSCSSSSSESE